MSDIAFIETDSKPTLVLAIIINFVILHNTNYSRYYI